MRRSALLFISAMAIVQYAGAAKAQQVSGGQHSDTAAQAVTMKKGAHAPPPDSASGDTILVTAARRPQASQWIPDDHQVVDVTRERENSSKTAAELLEERLPARFSDYGGGSLKNISLRGAGSERTLVLVDGRRIGTGDQALQDLGDIPSEAIERIEVVEGGQSALYGMDAVGGVVNIITKRPQTERLSVKVSSMLGSYEPQHDKPGLNDIGISGTMGQKRGPFGLLFGADARSGDGRFEYADTSGGLHYRENDSILEGGLFGRLDYNSEGYSVGVNGGFRERSSGSPGPVSWPQNAITRKNVGYGAVDGTWKVAPVLSLKASGSFDYNGVQYIDRPMGTLLNGTVNNIPDTSTNDWSTQSAECTGNFTLGGQQILAGISGMRKSVASNQMIAKDTSSLQGGVFASAILERTLSGFTVDATPAVRGDYTSIFGGALTGKCGLMAGWNGLLKPALFFTIGNSFRSPTLSDLYWKDPYMVGNPDLKPERGWNWDAGAQVRHRSGPLDVTARAGMYQLRLTDMLAWVLDPTTYVSYRENVAAAVIKGYTFKTSVSVLDKYTTSFDFVYNNARDTATNKVLTYRPEYMVTYANSLDLGRFCAGISARYVSMEFTDAANTASIPASLTFDANAGCEITPGGPGSSSVRLTYDVLNLTNERNFTNAGYPLPGREHRLGVKVGF